MARGVHAVRVIRTVVCTLLVAGAVAGWAAAAAASAADRLDAADALTFLRPYTSSTQGDPATFDPSLGSALFVRICDLAGRQCAPITSQPFAGSVLATQSLAYVARWKAPLVLLPKGHTISVSLKGLDGGAPIALGDRRFTLAPPLVGPLLSTTDPTVTSLGLGTVPFYLSVSRHPVVRARQLALQGIAPAQAAQHLYDEFGQSWASVADALQAGYGLQGSDVLRALLAAGASAADGAAALRTGLGFDTATIASALRAAGASLSEAAVALRTGLALDVTGAATVLVETYGLTSSDAPALATSLAGTGATLAETAGALVLALALDDAALVAALRDGSGAAMHEVAHVLQQRGVSAASIATLLDDAYDPSLAALTGALLDLGLTDEAVAVILRDQLGASAQETAGALATNGTPPTQIAIVLAASYGACDVACLVAALRNAGFTAQQIGTAVREQQPAADPVVVVVAFDTAGFSPGDVHRGTLTFLGPPLAPLEHMASLYDRAAFSAAKALAAMRDGEPDIELGLILGALHHDDLYPDAEIAAAFRDRGTSAVEYTELALSEDVMGTTPLVHLLQDVFALTRFGVARTFAQSDVSPGVQGPFLPGQLVSTITDALPLSEATIPATARDIARGMQGHYTPRQIADGLDGEFTYKLVAAGLDDLGLSFHALMDAIDGVLRKQTQAEVDHYADLIEAQGVGPTEAQAFAEQFARPAAMARTSAIAWHYALARRPVTVFNEPGITFVLIRLGRMDEIPQIMRGFGVDAPFIARTFKHLLGHTPSQVVARLHEAGFTDAEIDPVVEQLYGDQGDPEDDETSHADFGNLADFSDIEGGIDTGFQGSCNETADPAYLVSC